MAPHSRGGNFLVGFSCLENPMDRGAWWAAVYGFAQSRTRLKHLLRNGYVKPDKDRVIIF